MFNNQPVVKVVLQEVLNQLQEEQFVKAAQLEHTAQKELQVVRFVLLDLLLQQIKVLSVLRVVQAHMLLHLDLQFVHHVQLEIICQTVEQASA